MFTISISKMIDAADVRLLKLSTGGRLYLEKLYSLSTG
jgi:hypothetical protein